MEQLESALAGEADWIQVNHISYAAELVNHLSSDEQQWVAQVIANFDQLTPRERQIADRLATSHNTGGIAASLTVSLKTAENYITHVYDKLGLDEMGRSAPHLRKVVILAKAYMINELR